MNVLKLVRQPDESVLLVVQATERVALRNIVLTFPYLRAEVELLNSSDPPVGDRQEAEVKNLRENAIQLLQFMLDVPPQAQTAVANIPDGGQLADFLAPNLDIDIA